MPAFSGSVFGVLRVKNEERWIKRCLESLFAVCDVVVIFDDHSTDNTESIVRSLCGNRSVLADGWLSRDKYRTIQYVRSPYAVSNEARDRDFLWATALIHGHPDWVLALDGDEALSRAALSYLCECPNLPEVGLLPIVYLWDGENQRRVDGIYGDAPDGYPKLRFPRLLYTKGYTFDQLKQMKFKRTGRGPDLHCGSLPQLPVSRAMTCALVAAPILHFGYVDPDLRRKKYEYYTSLDPGNRAEGEYKHIIGEPDLHAPGPVETVLYEV